MSLLAAFSERLRKPEPTFSAWVSIPEPMVAATLAQSPFDAVTLDMQHGAIDTLSALRAIPLVAAAGKPTLVRIPVGEFATASRLLDAGAAGIVAPMVNTVTDARAFAAFSKFPPVGQRSWGPNGAIALSALGPADYLARANGLARSLAMVETREALAILDDIIATDGIDGIFVGPSDLSIALSAGAGVDPHSAEVERALDHVVARCRAAGKVAGIYAITADRAHAWAARGFGFVCIGSDAGLLQQAARQAVAVARGS